MTPQADIKVTAGHLRRDAYLYVRQSTRSVLVNQSANFPSDARLWIKCRTCPARASNSARHCQRSRFTWERFLDLLRDFPLPAPETKVKIWGG